MREREFSNHASAVRAQWSTVRVVSGFRSRLRHLQPAVFAARLLAFGSALTARSTKSSRQKRENQLHARENLRRGLPQISRVIVEGQYFAIEQANMIHP